MIENYWPFWYGGLGIAAVSILLVLFGGRFISVTRGYVSLCSIITKKPYFHQPEMGGKFGFRTMFAVGIMIGGFLGALYNGGYNPTWEIGKFNQIWGDHLGLKAAVLGMGGFLWGYGSRMARGCTSGNSIAGLSKGSLASLITTAGFLIGGVAITNLIMHFIGAPL